MSLVSLLPVGPLGQARFGSVEQRGWCFASTLVGLGRLSHPEGSCVVELSWVVLGSVVLSVFEVFGVCVYTGCACVCVGECLCVVSCLWVLLLGVVGSAPSLCSVDGFRCVGAQRVRCVCITRWACVFVFA